MSPLRPSPSSPGSRGPMPQMPVIAEDGNTGEQIPERRGPIPRTPLRVPKKSYRRSNRSQRPPMPFIADPHPLSEKYEAGSATMSASASGSTTTPGDMEKSDDMLRKLDIEEGQSFGSHRRRWLRLLLIVGLIALVVLALAIGLGVGLSKKNNSSGGDDSESSSDETLYPAGSFTFDTSLQTTRTSCTSNPSTWRCYPYETGASAKFFWIIMEPDNDSSNYTISSTDNPFAPSFRNLTLSRLDQGNPDERFVFSFNTTRNIVPGDSIGPNNRAATCSFKDTQFEATIWTRRRNNESIPLDGRDDNDFGDWPGDVEVKQIKKAELGQPMCEDSQGTEIADVQAGAGDCECGYANFEADE